MQKTILKIKYNIKNGIIEEIYGDSNNSPKKIIRTLCKEESCVLEIDGNSIPFKRILGGAGYVDKFIGIDNMEIPDSLKEKLSSKHFSHMFDPDKDETISFGNGIIKMSFDDKEKFVEEYYPYLNASYIKQFDNKFNIVAIIMINYENKNVFIRDKVNKMVYRYCGDYNNHINYESKFINTFDYMCHNNILDYKYEIDKYGIVKSDNYTIHEDNSISSTYPYNIPASLYENQFINMECNVLLKFDKLGLMDTFEKTIYCTI